MRNALRDTEAVTDFHMRICASNDCIRPYWGGIGSARFLPALWVTFFAALTVDSEASTVQTPVMKADKAIDVMMIPS